ncbi:Copper-exporting P-type ATPase A [Slackia heliotrinireducens]|uniref:Heavy metal translocating P-type ATPase n=1 Tax=Slackia heliotrinireducens (strain ATCC 29202 / DSM 20476 / NCTC 11029 / RHS 1) TaxID=471855 RepID=C7N3Y8_SLAHD|nr:heavy metal translocating P-type ATPase [Slackia heliotrinireducens]ACV21729.1 heavy metal translocating P-type ATPase [Slackia heliotrinireducens DSM 20476]VEG99375.1 Copper-exporting P-type ATPase A [Slackia heliotrinireducens]
MDFSIRTEIPGRMRLNLAGPVPDNDIDSLITVTKSCMYVTKVTVYARIGQLAVNYVNAPDARKTVIDHLRSIDAEKIAAARGQYTMTLAPRASKLFFQLANVIGGYVFRRWVLPAPLRAICTVVSFLPFLKAGVAELANSRLTVPVLDMSAIAISFLKRDFNTAGSTMLLLNVGEILEDYTRASSENALINSLLDVPESARKVIDGDEMIVPSNELAAGDLVVVRTGQSICVDGVIEAGEGAVNQASLTGEPLAIRRSVGDDVYAGTAVEEGELYIRVRSDTNQTRLRSIVTMVNAADDLKAESQSRMEALADKIVPWNFLLAGLVAITTRSIIKTSAALMVDYSCALKLTGSIAVMTAMSNAAKAGVTTKGAKHFETFANADTIVFDKTGTLTEAAPKLAKVESLDPAWPEEEVLRLAACLEEHFPHPVARAVVHGAMERNLEHRERHAAVEYIVAHGIASSLDGHRVVIGSRHFVIEDEHVPISDETIAYLEDTFHGLSPLYLAVNHKLVGVLGVQDPLKADTRKAIQQLRDLGFKHVVMLTGDAQKTAERIAAEAGIDEFQANMLPEDKFAYLERLKEEGRVVAMVGDGVNDSPALSRADVGVAMGQGSDIAKEVADIVLSGSNLDSLVMLRQLSQELMNRLNVSYASTMTINSALLALGILGVISPQLSSLLHNASTVAMSLRNTAAYLPQHEKELEL